MDLRQAALASTKQIYGKYSPSPFLALSLSPPPLSFFLPIFLLLFYDSLAHFSPSLSFSFSISLPPSLALLRPTKYILNTLQSKALLLPDGRFTAIGGNSASIEIYDPAAHGTPRFEKLGPLYNLPSTSRQIYAYNTASDIDLQYVAFPVRYYATPGVRFILGGEGKAEYVRDIEP